MRLRQFWRPDHNRLLSPAQFHDLSIPQLKSFLVELAPEFNEPVSCWRVEPLSFHVVGDFFTRVPAGEVYLEQKVTCEGPRTFKIYSDLWWYMIDIS